MTVMYTQAMAMAPQPPLLLQSGWPQQGGRGEATFMQMTMPAMHGQGSPAPEMHGQGSSNYKTVMCNNWKAGVCRFGPNCRFAHGEADLVRSHDTVPCVCDRVSACNDWSSDGGERMHMRNVVEPQPAMLFHCLEPGCMSDALDLPFKPHVCA